MSGPAKTVRKWPPAPDPLSPRRCICVTCQLLRAWRARIGPPRQPGARRAGPA